MLKLADTHSGPEPRAVADRFTKLFADAAADGIVLDDERELHAAFLSASLAGEHERCRMMVADAASRLGAMKAARIIAEEQRRAANEMAGLRQSVESAVTSPPICFRPNWRSLLDQFVEAEAAGDIAKCREVAEVARNSWRAKWRSPEEIEAERKAGQEAARKAVEAAEAARKREAHVAALRQRCAQGWNVLAEIEKFGTLRLGEDGAVLYSGQPLDDDLMMAIEWKAADIRNALRQRWHDRVVIAATAPAAAFQFDGSAAFDGSRNYI